MTPEPHQLSQGKRAGARSEDRGRSELQVSGALVKTGTSSLSKQSTTWRIMGMQVGGKTREQGRREAALQLGDRSWPWQ